MPVRAALATARTDDLIRFNPADGLLFPKREAIQEDDDDEVKALSREQLAALIAMAPPRHRLLIEFVAETGLRISEAIGLQRKHLRLDTANPHVRIRRAIVFPSMTGTVLDPDNARNRVLKPLYEAIGAPSAGWHTSRHTYASLQIANAANIVQLSRVLGHHSPAFTLGVYAHLLPGEEAPALDLDEALRVNSGVSALDGEALSAVA